MFYNFDEEIERKNSNCVKFDGLDKYVGLYKAKLNGKIVYIERL